MSGTRYLPHTVLSEWRLTVCAAGQPRFPQDNSYGNSRPTSSFRPESHFGPTTSGTVRNSYMEGYGNQNTYNQRNHGNNGHPDHQQQLYGGRGQNVYPQPHKDRSYETVTSAGGSGNSEPVGYHTDPTSSDNSSIERRSPAKRQQQPVNDYGIGFTQNQHYQSEQFSVGSHPLPAPPPQSTAPVVPRKDMPSALRREVSQAPSEKRKSWFSRRLSRNL